MPILYFTDILNISCVSDYKDADDALKYGSTISAPRFLEGFFARIVYVVDTNGKIIYKEVVSEITNEPKYGNIIKAVNGLTN